MSLDGTVEGNTTQFDILPKLCWKGSNSVQLQSSFAAPDSTAIAEQGSAGSLAVQALLWHDESTFSFAADDTILALSDQRGTGTDALKTWVAKSRAKPLSPFLRLNLRRRLSGWSHDVSPLSAIARESRGPAVQGPNRRFGRPSLSGSRVPPDTTRC